MTTPAQLAQQDEARNRALPSTEDGGRQADPQQTLIDDSTGQVEDAPQRQEARTEREEPREEPVAKDRRTPSDIARAEMAERFKKSRIEKEGDVPYNGNPNDPEMQYGRVAAETLEPDDTGAEILGGRIEATEPSQQQDQQEQQPKLTKLVIRGKDVWLTDAQILERASKVEAADSYLDESRMILENAKEIRAGRTGRDDQHPDRQSGAQDDGLSRSTATEASTTPDELEQAIEEIQFGDPKEAAKRLRNVVAKAADESADKRQAERLVNNELAKSQKTLKEFTAANPEIAKDDAACAVLLENIYGIYRDDLIKTGIDPSKLPTDKEALAKWHSFARANGQNVTPIERVFETAKSKYQAWRGGTPQAQRQQPQKSAPRIDVNVDRTQRREAIPSQPTRTVAARPDTVRQAPQARSRTDIVMNMRKQRGQVVGQ